MYQWRQPPPKQVTVCTGGARPHPSKVTVCTGGANFHPSWCKPALKKVALCTSSASRYKIPPKECKTAPKWHQPPPKKDARAPIWSTKFKLRMNLLSYKRKRIHEKHFSNSWPDQGFLHLFELPFPQHLLQKTIIGILELLLRLWIVGVALILLHAERAHITSKFPIF